MASRTLRFAESARVLAAAAARLGLVAPAFRSPPLSPQRDRSIRRDGANEVVVAVRLTGRPFTAVQSDLVDGVIAANELRGEQAETVRRELWNALAFAGALPGDQPTRLRVA